MTVGRPAWSGAAGVILIFAATRALLLAAGTYGATTFSSGREVQGGNLQRPWTGSRPLEMWARWDSEWYLLIAERGYHLEEALRDRRVDYRPADATGFFPLYPMLIRGLSRALLPLHLPGWSARGEGRAGDSRLEASPRQTALLLAGLLVSNAALLGSALLLVDRAAYTPPIPGAGSGRHAEPRAPLLAAAALLCYPPSLFLSAVYAESLLLFLTLLCFKLLRERKWWAAATAGACASAAKPSGLLLAIPAFVALARPGAEGGAAGRTGGGRRWLSLPLYAGGAAAFSIYCGREFGDPLVWIHRQDRWRGAASGPWQAFVRWWQHPQIHGAHGSTVELAFALLMLGLLVAVFRTRPYAESTFAAAVVALPLCSTLWSFGRLSLQAFPAFIALGAFAARRPAASLLYFAPAAAGSAVLMAYFAAWWWAG